MKAILGRKVGMTQIFEENGRMIPVTVIEAGPCYISQIRTADKDGYNALQIGFSEAKKLNKPEEGHLKKIGKMLKVLREVRLEETVKVEVAEGEEAKEAQKTFKVGDEIKADIFVEGDKVSVVGTSKGKGFAGVIKRHNFHRGPMSHGSHHHRAPGSIGAMFPQHVVKGTKLPGRMGGDRVTVKNLKIVRIDSENNMIAIKGAIPGPNKGFVLIKGLK